MDSKMLFTYFDESLAAFGNGVLLYSYQNINKIASILVL